jgi:Rieske Fe-S protein
MPIAPDAFKPCLLWETGDPYHYVRCWRDDGGDTWLIVGGEDHKTGQPGEPVDRFARLRAWARDHLGIDAAIGHAWSGQVQEPHDGLGYIGRNPSDEDNVFVATGDSGNGMTHGTLAALLIADLIEGRGSPWEALYSPSRQMVRAASDYLRENANVAVQYGDLVTGGDVDDVEAIAIGSGAIIRRGTSKHAVYRDGAGMLHAHSAICPHLGCVVQWNGIEKTWDCPCHGSRFRAEDGRVIMGPANHPLGPAAVE